MTTPLLYVPHVTAPRGNQALPHQSIPRRVLLLLILAGLSALATASTAPAEPQVSLEVFYLDDTQQDLSVDESLQRFRQGAAEQLTDATFNKGNHDSKFWIYIRAMNHGDSPLVSMLDTGVPFRAGLTVYKFNDRLVPKNYSEAIVLQTGDNQDFYERSPPGLILHSSPFVILPGESIELLLDYMTRGSTYMPMSLVQPAVFDSVQQSEALRSVFFYTASCILLIVFVMVGIALKDLPMLLYAGLFFVGLLFIAANEGYAFQYLWPESPVWNQYAGLCLLFIAISMGFLIARHATAPQDLTLFGGRVLLVLGAISAGLALLCAQLPFSLLIDVAGVLALVAYLVQIYTVSSWMRHSFRRYLGSFVGVLVITPCIIVLTLLSMLGVDLPDIVFDHAARALYLLSVICTLAALTLNVTALRQDYEETLEHSLLAAERDSTLSRALLESEQNYNQAREAALAYKQRLASNSHDIRQPLTALRAVLDSLELEPDSRERETVTATLNYMAQLSEPANEDDRSTLSYVQVEDVPKDPYPADLLLSTVQSMFQDEARNKSIHLKTVSCSQLLQQPPLILMRILTNMTANALKHCSAGSVLLGCRRSANALRFDVIDTGPGIEKADIERLRQPYEVGESSDGEGLGLAICWQLAAQFGYHMDVESRVGKGSRFSVTITLASNSRPAGSAI